MPGGTNGNSGGDCPVCKREIDRLAQTKIVSTTAFQRVFVVSGIISVVVALWYLTVDNTGLGINGKVAKIIIAVGVIAVLGVLVGLLGIITARWKNPKLHLWHEGEHAEGNGEGRSNVHVHAATRIDPYPKSNTVGIAQDGAEPHILPTAIELQVGTGPRGNLVYVRGTRIAEFTISVSADLMVTLADGKDSTRRDLRDREALSDLFECVEVVRSVGDLGRLNRAGRKAARRLIGEVEALRHFTEGIGSYPETEVLKEALREIVSGAKLSLAIERRDGGRVTATPLGHRDDLVRKWKEHLVLKQEEMPTHPSLPSASTRSLSGLSSQPGGQTAS